MGSNYYDYPDVHVNNQNRARIDYDKEGFLKLAKATVTSTSFTNDYGKLLPARAAKLEDYIEDNSEFKGKCDFMLFDAEHGYVDSVQRSSSWNLYPQSETGPNNVVRGISTGRKTFTPLDYYMLVEISDKALRINLEGDNFGDHLLQIAAAGTANDLDKMILCGNSTGVVGADEDVANWVQGMYHIVPTMSQMDGVIPLLLANANRLNVSNYFTTWFNPIIAAAMEELFPSNRSKLRSRSEYFCSRKAWANYAFHLGNKGANTPFDFALYNAYMAGVQTLKHVDLPINKIPLLDDYPYFPETFQFPTANGTYQFAWAPMQANSAMIVDANTGATFQWPYTEGYSYSMDVNNAVITDSGTDMNDTTIYNCTYRMPGVAFLTWPFNIVLGMVKDNIEIEFGREPKNNKDFMILRISLDLLIRDYLSAVIAWGITYRNWALLQA